MPRKKKFTKPVKHSEEWWNLILDRISDSVEKEAEGAPAVEDPFAGREELAEWEEGAETWFFLPWHDKELHCYGEVLHFDLHARLLDVMLYLPHQPAGGRTTLPLSADMRWITKRQFVAAEMCGWQPLKERFVRCEMSDGSYEWASFWLPEGTAIKGVGMIYSAVFPTGREGRINSPYCEETEEITEEQFETEIAGLQEDPECARHGIIVAGNGSSRG
jgi:hypothetical protein